MATVNEKMTAIADAIRDKTKGTEPLSLDDIATAIPEVYKAGKDAQYNEFWDTAQQNGARTNYERAFAGMFWTNELLKPKWDIKPKWGGATSLFQGSPFEGNLREHFESLNVTLDVSGLSGATNMFYTAEKITEIPFLDLSGCTKLDGLFYGCKALTMAHIKLSEAVPVGNNCFANCTALENLTVEGTIGVNGFDVHWSTKLTKTSLISIVNALSQTAVGRTVTLSKTAVNNAFGINVDDVATFPEGSEWYNLRNSRSSWTFSYA